MHITIEINNNILVLSRFTECKEFSREIFFFCVFSYLDYIRGLLNYVISSVIQYILPMYFSCINIKTEKKCHFTDSPLYTDTRYNGKLHFNDNLTGTNPSLRR